jgi:hypothetical protein
MPDTKIRLPLGIPGWTLYTRLRNEAGQIWDSVAGAMVAYVVADVARYQLAMPETPAGSGDYESTMPVGLPAGRYTWAHYRRVGGSPAISDPLVGAGGDTWDGTSFGAAAGGGGAVTDADLESDVVVSDPAPTTLGFVVAMADGSDVPDSFVWRSGLACFKAASPLRTGKFPVATYTKLTSTTARLTFTPALPAAPANGEALRII